MQNIQTEFILLSAQDIDQAFFKTHAYSHNFRIFQATGFQNIGKLNAISNVILYMIGTQNLCRVNHFVDFRRSSSYALLKYKENIHRYNVIVYII